MSLEREALTGVVISAAIAVHRELGPGFLESVYDAALAIELRARGLGVGRQVSVPVVYRGVEVGHHRLDLVVEDEIVVELESVKDLTDAHFVVVRSYLRAARLKHGLLINFSKPRLEVRRVIASPRAPLR